MLQQAPLLPERQPELLQAPPRVLRPEPPQALRLGLLPELPLQAPVLAALQAPLPSSNKP
ncbi:hypothetical protein [Variovorax sp. dw_954]|uniref:hypothetical protein n=1 Tax=Variovorax sp. dw_954 TaxID=2720078 RepID=UPI001BD33F12|nr:hypothetical protein [Variovorax sp. dw_954]